jgi:hypothetical protein
MHCSDAAFVVYAISAVIIIPGCMLNAPSEHDLEPKGVEGADHTPPAPNTDTAPDAYPVVFVDAKCVFGMRIKSQGLIYSPCISPPSQHPFSKNFRYGQEE